MQEELEIIKRRISQMAEVINAVPGEKLQLQEMDTLLILQRRMHDCDLKKALSKYNVIFSEEKGVLLESLIGAAEAFIEIKVLLEQMEEDFSPAGYRELIKEYRSQIAKVTNIIHLSKVNYVMADDYQKDKILLTEKKNQAFLEAFEKEVEQLEKYLERMPEDKEELQEIQPDEKKDKREKRQVVKPKAGVFENSFARIKKGIVSVKEKKEVDEKLKDIETGRSQTSCGEISFYDHNLISTEVLICKDISSYSIVRRRGNIYFGKTENISKATYDNRDQSLLELTKATEEFVQFMTQDLLNGEYELSIFSEKEKQGLCMYFDFMCFCFENYIGKTITVQEYLQFKTYYNRLVQRMLALETQEKEDYYRAMYLVDVYKCYVDSYGLGCTDSKDKIISNLMEGRKGEYLDDLDFVVSNHIVDSQAKAEIEQFQESIRSFRNKEVVGSLVLESLAKEVGIEEMPIKECLINEAGTQEAETIVVQRLNSRGQIEDEAVYASANFRQALMDFEVKDAYRKRLGLRGNGQDFFIREG